MRKIVLSAFLLLTMFCSFGQTSSKKVCRLGFTYDISKNSNWGKNNLVVTSVKPYSNAEKAGIQPYDIITHIEDIPVSSVSKDEIIQLLNPANKRNIMLTIKSTLAPSREVILNKECKPINEVSEDQLAMAFNMYSLETTSVREFVCPFKTIVTTDTVDFAQFHTYKFAASEENTKLEADINQVIEKELTKKGFTSDNQKPDFLIQTFYYFDKNPNYVGPSPIKLKQPVYRFNINRNKMEKVPFLEPSASESEAAYLLQLGIRIIDQKVSAGRVLWECEANELLEEAYHLEEYAQIHVPLMLMQFPYLKNKKNVHFIVSQCSYNYTGINYNMDKLSSVVSVDRNSPAYEAGVRAKDVIEGIEGQSTDYSIEEFTAAYRQFITNTMTLRNPDTRFTDSKGFSRCMYWDAFKYPQVTKAIQNPNNLTAFAYLYYFAPYINPTSNNAITFYVKQGSERKKIIIRPTIRTGITIELK